MGRALAGFQTVVAADPESTQSHGNVGLCYGSPGRAVGKAAVRVDGLVAHPNFKLVDGITGKAKQEGSQSASAASGGGKAS